MQCDDRNVEAVQPHDGLVAVVSVVVPCPRRRDDEIAGRHRRALAIDGRPAVGVVLDPTRSETFAATADGPATLNGRPIRASEKDKLSDYVISLGLSGRSVVSRARTLRKEIRVSRSMGSAALGLAYVANGRFDAFVQETSLSAWDIAAAGLIAERAGAVVTPFEGSRWYDPARPPRRAGIVAAPPAFHERIRALARGH
jgi:myo-inositol-1(or 4)-monophosphatase